MKSTLALVALFIAGFIAFLMAFMAVNDWWEKRAKTELERDFTSIHLLAIVVALIGAGLAWMSFANGYEDRWIHLFLPVFFVAIVYGFALGANGRNWELLARDIVSRFERKN
jgi:MFS family permease